MMIIWLCSTIKPIVVLILIWGSWPRWLIQSCGLRFSLEIWSFISLVYKRFYCCICLVKVFLSFFLTNAIFEAAYLIKLTNCTIIQFIDALECLLAKSLLVICEKESSKLLSLKKVFSMILDFRHCQYFSSIWSLIIFWCWVLCYHIYSTTVHLFWIISVFIHFSWNNVMSCRNSSIVTNWIFFLKNVGLFSSCAWNQRRSNSPRFLQGWFVVL